MAIGDQFEGFDPAWWQTVLTEVEPVQYYSSPAAMAFGRRSPSRRRFVENSYQDILKDYYREAGTSMRSGREPMSFMEFLDPNEYTPSLELNRRDPFTERYSRLPQTARGLTGMASNPRTRFLFNY